MKLWQGTCIVHETFSARKLAALKLEHPDAEIIAHPECEGPVLAMASFIGSTTKLLEYAVRSPGQTFIVATEWAIVHQLKKRFPDREFVMADGCIGCRLHCPYMKMNDLGAVKRALETGRHEIRIPADVLAPARRALERMLAVPRDR